MVKIIAKKKLISKKKLTLKMLCPLTKNFVSKYASGCEWRKI